MLTYIAYGTLPFILFSFVISGYILGSWIKDKDEDCSGPGVFLGVVISAVAILISVVTGGTTERQPIGNITGMLGLNLGCCLVLFLVLICDYIKRRVDVKASIDNKVDEIIKKRKLENDIILKKAGL
jgi:hypothetical protein